MLQHYVLIEYEKGVGEEHITEFCNRMRALRLSIAEIEHLEIGRDTLRDSRSWDLILIMRFTSVGELRSYQQHPEHLKVMEFNRPFVTNVATVDFE